MAIDTGAGVILGLALVMVVLVLVLALVMVVVVLVLVVLVLVLVLVWVWVVLGPARIRFPPVVGPRDVVGSLSCRSNPEHTY